MTIDVSLIPQNRVENLISKLSEIENNIGNIGTDITNNVVHKNGDEVINGTKTFNDYIVLNAQGGNEGAQIDWRTGNLSVLQDSPFIDQGNIIELFGDNKTLWLGIKEVINNINHNADVVA